MKKLLFMVILMVIAVGLTSCESKPQGTPLKGNDNLLVFEKNGLLEIKNADGTSLLMGNLYENIDWDINMEVIIARKGAETTLAWPDGHSILTDNVTKIQSTSNGFYEILTVDQQMFLFAGPNARKKYNITGDGLWGKMSKIAVVDDFVFMRRNGLWGVAQINPRNGLTPIKYQSVYILKNQTTFAILLNDGKELYLYNNQGVENGAPYNLNSAAINKQLKRNKIKLPNESYGVVDVNWKF